MDLPRQFLGKCPGSSTWWRMSRRHNSFSHYLSTRSYQLIKFTHNIISEVISMIETESVLLRSVSLFRLPSSSKSQIIIHRVLIHRAGTPTLLSPKSRHLWNVTGQSMQIKGGKFELDFQN